MSPLCMILAATTLEIVEAGGAIAGVISLVFVIAGRYAVFWPKFDPAFDENRQAIRLKIKNRGRRSGQVDDVAVVDRNGIELPADFAGLAEESFHPAELKRGKKKLIIRARESDGPFSTDARIYASWESKWGWRVRSKTRYFDPRQPKKGTGSFFPEKSDWPRA